MLYSSPVFGVSLTLVVYFLAEGFKKRTGFSFANPLLISILILMGIIKVLSIPLEAYEVGGAHISFFIKPATVALAIPLYYHYDVLVKNIKAVSAGIFVGVSTSILSVSFLSKVFGLEEVLKLSLLSKSITTPIGIELTQQVGGIVPVAIASIIFTGIFGALIGPWFLKTIGVKDKTALGIALGTSAHVIGTSKAIELNEEVGAMSAIAIPLAGILTVLLAPLIMF